MIEIKNFAFQVPATVAAGAMVTVTNHDSMAHTVTASGGAFDVLVAGGATATFTAPTEPGSYDFSCTFHGNMKGTLVVF
jgi:plastocyanin